jgi:CDP-paratose 2-epimerase
VARAIELFYQHPQTGAVFNLGGGRGNTVSILEAFDRVAQITGKPMRWKYSDKPRAGDHICYISDLSLLRHSLPGWDITKTLDDIFEEIASGWQARLQGEG